jgi:hypothetical protein
VRKSGRATVGNGLHIGFVVSVASLKHKPLWNLGRVIRTLMLLYGPICHQKQMDGTELRRRFSMLYLF